MPMPLYMQGTCEDCHQEMAVGAGCSIDIFDDYPGGEVHRQPYEGAEPCADCRVTAGQYHHPGCVEEVCTVCSQKVMGCACPTVQVQ